MSSNNSSGFDHAPLTKLIVVSATLCSVLASGLNITQLSLDANAVLSAQLHRVLISQLFFKSTGEMFSGVLLLYTLRTIERQLGERKFSSYVFFSFLFSTLLQIVYLLFYKNPKLIFSGPYSTIFSLFVLYVDTPPFWKGSLLGLPVSDKLLTYLLGLQLMLSNGSNSFIPAFTGIIAGLIQHLGVLRTGVDIPVSIRTFCYKYIRPLLHTSRPSTVAGLPPDVEVISLLSRRIGQQGGRGNAGMAGPANGVFGGANPGAFGANAGTGVRHLNRRRPDDAQQQQQIHPNQPPPSSQQVAEQRRQQLEQVLQSMGYTQGIPQQQQQQTVNPSEENIRRLMEMGFTRDDSTNLLRQTNNDLQMALDFIVS